MVFFGSRGDFSKPKQLLTQSITDVCFRRQRSPNHSPCCHRSGQLLLYFLVITCLCFLVQLITGRSLVTSIVDYLFAFCFSVLSYLCVLIAT